LSELGVEEILVEGAHELGVEINYGEKVLFFEYLEIIKFWNEKFNLTNIEGDKDIVIKHFLDSFSICSFIDENSRLLDIGSGAGFPGIPLKIVNPGIQITLMDSVLKKCNFLKEVVRKLRLDSVSVLRSRAENIGEDNRNSFDYVVARAVHGIGKIFELGHPYIKDGGTLIFMRGRQGASEWEEFLKGNKANILSYEEKSFFIPFSNEKRFVVAARFCDYG